MCGGTCKVKGHSRSVKGKGNATVKGHSRKVAKGKKGRKALGLTGKEYETLKK